MHHFHVLGKEFCTDPKTIYKSTSRKGSQEVSPMQKLYDNGVAEGWIVGVCGGLLMIHVN